MRATAVRCRTRTQITSIKHKQTSHFLSLSRSPPFCLFIAECEHVIDLCVDSVHRSAVPLCFGLYNLNEKRKEKRQQQQQQRARLHFHSCARTPMPLFGMAKQQYQSNTHMLYVMHASLSSNHYAERASGERMRSNFHKNAKIRLNSRCQWIPPHTHTLRVLHIDVIMIIGEMSPTKYSIDLKTTLLSSLWSEMHRFIGLNCIKVIDINGFSSLWCS